VSAAERHTIVTAAETKALFAGLNTHSSLILAVSGGPDSTALLYLAARWRDGLRKAPKLVAVTVDHGLRQESASEARAVAQLCRKLNVPHRTLRWRGAKPKSGLQEAARHARYALLAAEASRHGARHVLTAHTLDDQAETILFRLARGTGLSGVIAMARESEFSGVTIVRPLLEVPKARLLATLSRAKIPFADDPSNRDPRFTRPRLREIMPLLEKEGLSARRLSLFAGRVRRAEAALADAVAKAAKDVSRGPKGERWGELWGEGARIAFDADNFLRLPEEVSLRLLGRALGHVGSEGPVELAKLETLHAALLARRGDSPLRRTLAGAMVSCAGGLIVVERAPPRRTAEKSTSGRRISALTKSEHGAVRLGEGRAK
jgi:tRNA(Ile)-lysidine synthase